MTPLALVGDEEAGKSFRFRQLLYPALEFRALHTLMVGQTCPNVKWPPGAEGLCRAEALLWVPSFSRNASRSSHFEFDYSEIDIPQTCLSACGGGQVAAATSQPTSASCEPPQQSHVPHDGRLLTCSIRTRSRRDASPHHTTRSRAWPASVAQIRT